MHRLFPTLIGIYILGSIGHSFIGWWKIIKWLNGEVGSLPAGQTAIKIDGVGFQGHWKIGWPSTANIQTAINAFTVPAIDVKVKISELDISIYDSSAEGEKSFTSTIAAQQATRYDDLFTLFRANAAHITSVTFWGVSDDATWLDNFPVPGRNDYPLLFDDDHERKPAYDAVVNF